MVVVVVVLFNSETCFFAYRTISGNVRTIWVLIGSLGQRLSCIFFFLRTGKTDSTFLSDDSEQPALNDDTKTTIPQAKQNVNTGTKTEQHRTITKQNQETQSYICTYVLILEANAEHWQKEGRAGHGRRASTLLGIVF